MFDPLYFDRRLTVAVPAEFGAAVKEGAARAGLTVADYARRALSDHLARDGVGFEPPPILDRRTDADISGRV